MAPAKGSPADGRGDLLLAQYVSAFLPFDEMYESPDICPHTRALATRPPDEYGYISWRPKRVDPDPDCPVGVE